MDDQVSLSMREKTEKLKLLALDCGLSTKQLLEHRPFDSVQPGICTNPGCDYTDEVEPDQANGFCAECETETVASVLVLAGLI
jgi:hypothetical protein